MSNSAEGASQDQGPQGASAAPDTPGPADHTRPSLTTQVRHRRADQAFFLRLRDAIAQNHRALERLGT
jgi:hypothetical protein